MGGVCTCFCVVGVDGCSCGDDFSGFGMRGKGRDRRAPDECGPVWSPPPPAIGMCRDFRVYGVSVSKVV